MVRRAEGRIYPWSFDKTVDLDASEDAFIKRMTNTCTYLPGEEVLPKGSLIYCSFEVLNELNNIRINGVKLPVTVKQELYEKLFKKHQRVTPRRIKDYLIANNYMTDADEMSGLDITVKSSLRPFLRFQRLLETGLLTPAQVE